MARVYRSKKYAKRFAGKKSVRKVKGGYAVGK